MQKIFDHITPFFAMFSHIQWSDAIDIIIVAIILYFILILLRKTRSYYIVDGFLVLLLLYGVAYVLNLHLTEMTLSYFFAFFVVIVVIIFQKEWRSFFEWISIWGRIRRTKQGPLSLAESIIHMLSESIEYMTNNRIGALIVLPGQQPLEPHLEGGSVLNGKLSVPLLLSIFDSSSPGHDGAVLLEGDCVKRFSMHLPLADSPVENKGTRHRAALGLAERSDAFIIVVSEERGDISIARKGTLKTVSLETLQKKLEEFYRLHAQASAHTSWKGWFFSHTTEKVMSTVIALGLWSVFIFQPGIINKEYTIPIQFKYLSKDYVVQEVVPETITVVLSGRSFDLNALSEDSLSVVIDSSYVQEGWNRAKIDTQNIEKPQAVSVIKVSKNSVNFLLKKIE